MGPNAPAVNVSLYEAMKYCNWLTTGDTNSGYYNTPDGGVTYQANSLSHDAYAVVYGTTYFVPTEDEWVKAAYWTGSGYSLYANGTNTVPVKGGGASGWNYDYANSSPNFTRGAVLGTIEQNGTFNMMGNVYEWMEDSAGVIRGGGYYSSESTLRLSDPHDVFPLAEYIDIGFRPVVVVPMSATAPLLMMSGLDISWQSEIGWNYSVMTTTNLVMVLWAPVPGWTASGTGNMLIYTNTYTDKQRFFKVTVGNQ